MINLEKLEQRLLNSKAKDGLHTFDDITVYGLLNEIRNLRAKVAAYQKVVVYTELFAKRLESSIYPPEEYPKPHPFWAKFATMMEEASNAEV